jgi:hypothetical protein
MQFFNPLYYIDISIYECNYALFINQIPIIREDKNMSISCEIPINGWIFNGNNEVVLLVFPKIGEEYLSESYQYKLTLFCRAEFDELERTTLVKIDGFNKNKANSSTFVERKNFIAEVQFDPLWRQGMIFENSSELKGQLLKEYNKIQEVILKKDVLAFIDITSKRILDLANCFYFEREKKTVEVKENVIKDFFDKNLSLIRINETLLELKIFAYGKLACLEYKSNCSAIVFENTETKKFLEFPFMFSKFEANGPLVVVR